MTDFEIETVLTSYNGNDEIVEIPRGITTINNNCFSDRRNTGIPIKKIIVPEGVTKIKMSAFYFCGNLKEVILPSTLIDISANAFTGCRSLENIQVSEKNPLYASRDGILYKRNLNLNNPYYKIKIYPSGKPEKTFEIPEDVKEVSTVAFDNFSNVIERIIINDTFGNESENAFGSMRNLKIVTLKKDNQEIDIYIDNYKLTGELPDMMRAYNYRNRNTQTLMNRFADISYKQVKIPFALFMLFAYGHDEFLPYIKRSIKNVVKYLADHNETALLERVLELGFVTKKNIDELIDYVNQNQNIEVQAILMNYKNENFGYNSLKL